MRVRQPDQNVSPFDAEGFVLLKDMHAQRAQYEGRCGQLQLRDGEPLSAPGCAVDKKITCRLPESHECCSSGGKDGNSARGISTADKVYFMELFDRK